MMRHMPSMAGHRRRQILLAVLVAVAAAAAVRLVAGSLPDRAGAKGADAAAAVYDGGAAPVWPRASDVSWPSELCRDVFADISPVVDLSPPPPPPAPDADSRGRDAGRAFRVTAITTGNPPRAVINGVVCHPGDMIHGYVVVRIQGRRILLARDGVEIEVGM